MENGDSLYARIAELEKENDILRGKYSDLWHCGMNDDLSEVHIVEMLLRKGEKDRVMEVWSKVYEDMSEFNEDSEDEDIKCEICGKGNGELGLTALEMDYDDTTGFHCCQGQECLRQFWKSLPQLRGRCNEDAENNE